jgi:HSP20 family protein
MNQLMKANRPFRNILTESRDAFFGRSIEDIMENNFFNSFDSNIHEGRDSYTLEIAVPGMERKDITIHLDDTIMWVSAQKDQKDTSWDSMEFNNKRLQRSFTLPDDADINNIKAKCRNGLLTIHIGKVRVKGTPRVIKVNGESPDQSARKLTSWWKRLKDTTHQLFVRKR